MDTTKTLHSLFHAFCIRPGLRFDNQQADETVILVLRAHPITQIGWMINSLFFLIVLLMVDYFLSPILNGLQMVFVNFFGFGLIVSYFWFNFLSWFFNVGIVTDKRVVDIDFSSVLYHEVSEAWLTKIQDITEKTGGFLASFTDYGNVFVQTAGTEQNVEFINVPKPSIIVRAINELVQKKV